MVENLEAVDDEDVGDNDAEEEPEFWWRRRGQKTVAVVGAKNDDGDEELKEPVAIEEPNDGMEVVSWGLEPSASEHGVAGIVPGGVQEVEVVEVVNEEGIDGAPKEVIAGVGEKGTVGVEEDGVVGTESCENMERVYGGVMEHVREEPVPRAMVMVETKQTMNRVVEFREAAGVTIQRDLSGVRMALEAQFELNIEDGNVKGDDMVLREGEFGARVSQSASKRDTRGVDGGQKGRKGRGKKDSSCSGEDRLASGGGRIEEAGRGGRR